MRLLPSCLKSASLFVLVLISSSLIAQYKNDNVAFKTVYMEEFCKQFKSNQKAVLLDVRSLGEYKDTSASSGLNIGRLKATANIDIQELPARWRELSQYKDQPVYMYIVRIVNEAAEHAKCLLIAVLRTSSISMAGLLHSIYWKYRSSARIFMKQGISLN